MKDKIIMQTEEFVRMLNKNIKEKENDRNNTEFKKTKRKRNGIQYTFIENIIND